MGKTFVVGDIHGRFGALQQVLKSCNFRYNLDTLIVLGDVVDGGQCSSRVVHELMKIRKLVFVLGNHDVWFIDYMKNGWMGDIWLKQGGEATLRSFGKKILEEHRDFFRKGVPYYELDGDLFVHGGFDQNKPISEQNMDYLTWDRSIIDDAIYERIKGYKRVFIGHTTTQHIDGGTDPVKLNNLWCLDCGAGWNGRLCIMDIKTEQYWLSDVQKKPVD